MKFKSLIILVILMLGLFSFGPGDAVELLLRDNLNRAQPGDYLVTVQNKNYTILIIRSKDGEQLSIEEITMPMSRMPKQTFSWRNWVQGGAPGHTCWVMYTIHLPTGTIQQTFSFTKNDWVAIPQAQNFLSTLLNLHLKPVQNSERKKVGPRTASDQADRRAYWQPQMVVDGKVIQGVTFDVWRTRWPKDGTELSGKIIEVYVPKENDKYPSYFPYWLQVRGIVGHAKVRIVDSGIQLFSPTASK